MPDPLLRAIPYPQPTLGSIKETVLALKMVVELLAGMRGSNVGRSARYEELVSLTTRLNELILRVDATEVDIDAVEAAIIIVGDALAAHIANVSNPHAVTKAQVGLSSADNTSDINKPVSTAQATADNLRLLVSAVSAFMLTVLDDADAVAVLATLGIAAGTWTATAALETPGTSSFTYTAQQGSYFKISNCYLIQLALIFTPTIGTGVGDFRYSLPATVAARTGYGMVSELSSAFVWPAGRTMVNAQFQGSNSYGRIIGLGTGVNGSAFGAAHLTNGVSHTVRLGGMFLT